MMAGTGISAVSSSRGWRRGGFSRSNSALTCAPLLVRAGKVMSAESAAGQAAGSQGSSGTLAWPGRVMAQSWTASWATTARPSAAWGSWLSPLAGWPSSAASSSTLSGSKRRCPPRVRRHSRRPCLAQRLTVLGCTCSRSAAWLAVRKPPGLLGVVMGRFAFLSGGCGLWPTRIPRAGQVQRPWSATAGHAGGGGRGWLDRLGLGIVEAVQVQDALERAGWDPQRPGGGVQAVAVGELGCPAGQPTALLVVPHRVGIVGSPAVGGKAFGLGLAAPDALQAQVGVGEGAALLLDGTQPADRLGGLVPVPAGAAGRLAVVKEQVRSLLGARPAVALGKQEAAHRGRPAARRSLWPPGGPPAPTQAERAVTVRRSRRTAGSGLASRRRSRPDTGGLAGMLVVVVDINVPPRTRQGGAREPASGAPRAPRPHGGASPGRRAPRPAGLRRRPAVLRRSTCRCRGWRSGRAGLGCWWLAG